MNMVAWFYLQNDDTVTPIVYNYTFYNFTLVISTARSSRALFITPLVSLV